MRVGSHGDRGRIECAGVDRRRRRAFLHNLRHAPVHSTWPSISRHGPRTARSAGFRQHQADPGGLRRTSRQLRIEASGALLAVTIRGEGVLTGDRFERMEATFTRLETPEPIAPPDRESTTMPFRFRTAWHSSPAERVDLHSRFGESGRLGQSESIGDPSCFDPGISSLGANSRIRHRNAPNRR